MARFNKYQIITMIALVTAGLFNPLSYEILKDYIELVFTTISLIAAAWCVGFLLYKVLKPEVVNTTPKKTKKTEKYIEI
jgi:hypothetical protein